MKVGEEALAILRRFHAFAPERFSTIAWMDWNGLHHPGFFQLAIERLQRFVALACGLKIWKDLGCNSASQMVNCSALTMCDWAAVQRSGKTRRSRHVSHRDPDAFFLPSTASTSAMKNWPPIRLGFHGSHYSKDELLSQRDRVFARHPTRPSSPRTWPRNGEPDLSRPPAFHLPECFCRYECQDCRTGPSTLYRPRFFSKTCRPNPVRHRFSAHHRDVPIAFRFLETADEYFEYPPRIAARSLEHLRPAPSGRRSPQNLSGKRPASVRLRR